MKRLLLLLLFVGCACAGNAQPVKLGIVTDFEQSEVLDSIFQLFTVEINKTIGPARTASLDPGQIIYRNVNLANTRANYDRIAPQSDLVILVGSVSVKGSLSDAGFPVPTIGLGIVDPYLQELPFENGKTGINNFSYIWAVRDLLTEFSVFQKITPFQNLTMLINEATAVTFNDERGQLYLDSLKNLFNTNIEVLGIGSNVDDAISGLPESTDAVYLTYLDDKTPQEIQAISNALIERNLPSFSGSKWHLDNGILACMSDDNDLEQVIRKLAIMADEAVNGEPLAEMLVNINFKEDLFINARTAEAIDIGLSFDIYFTANFVDQERDLPTYSLEEVMERAMEQNFEIKISNQDIALAIQENKLAKTAMMPNLDLGLSGSQINSESAVAAFNQPERRLVGDLALDQLIFSEEAVAGIKVTYFLQKAQEFATQAQILEVLLNAYEDYFTVLAAKTVVEIETENLENLKTNLELARVRVNSGSASRAEILRWDSEVAAANQTVVEANTNLLSAKYRLNTTLANTLEKEFDIEDITIDDQLYERFRDNALSQFVNDPKDIQVVVDFLIDESVTNNPNKQFVLQQINAANRQLKQNRRLFYTPNLALQAQTQQFLLRGGEGSSTEDSPFDPPPDNTWSIGIGLSYPIFAANTRKVNLQTSKIQLEQLENQRRQLDQDLELAVRTSVLNNIATYTNIGFSQTSSDNAVANFELVRDRYQAGEVSITQLFDAQVSALQAKQRYAVAVYDFIQSQLQLEFAVGFFSMFATAQELQDFGNRFLEFRNN